MKRLRVLWVGKTEQGFSREGVAHYLKRIGSLEPIESITIKSARHSGRSSTSALRSEGEAILKRLAEGEIVALLDEKGAAFTSRELAQWLDRLERGRIAFVVGGPFGVDERIKARADASISLSRLTLPHQLVRIILLEQIYRALTIRAGHAYHHD